MGEANRLHARGAGVHFTGARDVPARMTPMTVIGQYLDSVRQTRYGRLDEHVRDTDGYTFDLLDWDELNVAIDDLCAAYKDAQPEVRPVYPSRAPADRMR